MSKWSSKVHEKDFKIFSLRRHAIQYVLTKSFRLITYSGYYNLVSLSLKLITEGSGPLPGRGWWGRSAPPRRTGSRGASHGCRRRMAYLGKEPNNMVESWAGKETCCLHTERHQKPVSWESMNNCQRQGCDPCIQRENTVTSSLPFWIVLMFEVRNQRR
jgi:hypothetical protein